MDLHIQLWRYHPLNVTHQGMDIACLYATSPQHHVRELKVCKIFVESHSLRLSLIGYRVAQVRCFFKIHCHTAIERYSKPLAYVQWFSVPVKEAHIEMFRVARHTRSDQRRVGAIIEQSSIIRFIQLVPSFGTSVPLEMTRENSMETQKYYWINSFADKEIYQAIW
jgi:hypothetical protein